MAIIKLSEAAHWPSARWVFDAVIEDMLLHLPKDDPMYSRLQRSLEEKLYFLDLSEVNDQERRRLLACAKAVLEKTHKRSPESFDPPDFYPAFMNKVDQFVRMLESSLE